MFQILLFLLFWPSPAHFSGFFELEFVDGVSERSSADLCLKEMVSFVSKNDFCTFGRRREEWLKSRHSIRIPFTFRWTGSFSLIVRLHDHNPTVQTRVHLVSDGDSRPDTVWKYRSLTTGQRLRFRVGCDHNYHRDDCATFCRPRDDTFGHYTCDTNGRKVCSEGWRGENCEKPKCREACNEMHGFCELPNECTCRNGWKGIHCDECVEYPGCLHGYCLSPFQCICHRNWGGILCDQDLNYCSTHDPCLNDGQCQNVAPDHYRCLCRPGFAGINCHVVLDACATNPCLHSGQCLTTSGVKNGSSEEGFDCVCAKGFEGKRCERDVNECLSAPCLNGATCHDLRNAYRCQCGRGWTGSECHVDVDECSLEHKPCVHAIACHNRNGSFECACEPGFFGNHCETEVNECEQKSVLCANGGQCLDLVNDFRCVCRNHFSGQFCERLDQSVCSDHAHNHHFLWRFRPSLNTTPSTTLCLCDEGVAKCAPETTPTPHNTCSPETPEIRLAFGGQVVADICATILAIHSLISISRDVFCCHPLSDGSVVVSSGHVSRIRRYISDIWPQMTTIESLGESSTEGATAVWPVVRTLIAVVLILLAICSALLVVIRKRRRQRQRSEDSASNEVVIHCIQNNLKDPKNSNYIQNNCYFKRVFN